MKLRKAVIKDKLDTLKQAYFPSLGMAQDSVLPLDPVYKQIVKCSYWNMPGYENKIVTSRLVTSPFATEAAWIGCQRYTNRADFCLPLSNKTAQLAATAASRPNGKGISEACLWQGVQGSRGKAAEGSWHLN